MNGYSLPPLKIDLSLVLLDDLIEALQKRAANSVILLQMKDERPHVVTRWSGNYYTTLGLIEGYKSDLLRIDLAAEEADE